MPDIGALHPQIVHFVVACLILGLPIHLLGFLRRPRFFRPMATVLLLVGTVAAFAAVRSGDDAHGPAERIPDTRPLVVEHEELGEIPEEPEGDKYYYTITVENLGQIDPRPDIEH